MRPNRHKCKSHVLFRRSSNSFLFKSIKVLTIAFLSQYYKKTVFSHAEIVPQMHNLPGHHK